MEVADALICADAYFKACPVVPILYLRPMSTFSHIITRPGRMVLCLLLALLFVGERAMPCSDHDHCAEDESTGAAHVEQTSDHDDHSSTDTESHCSHCSCPCHVPAVIKTFMLPASQSITADLFSSYSHAEPTGPVDPLDHVPLL